MISVLDQAESSSSMNDDKTLSVAALAVALVALVVALGQLLGQYFATAEGYRRCQSSVMGPWARYTRLRWRMRQFRFETLFTTPQILFLPEGHDSSSLTGSASSTQSLLMISGAEHVTAPVRDLFTVDQNSQKDEDLVCWVSLLQSLYFNRRKLEQFGCYNRSSQHLTSPDAYGAAIRLRERSWDFMPPEMVRPVAITSISDLAIIARRLGMRWTDFRPEDNTMRAEGNGHVLNSTLVRSIGIIMQYMDVGDPFSAPKKELYIPTRLADAMGFGILPRSQLIYRAEFRIGTIEEILAVLDQIDPSGVTTKTARDTNAVGGKPFGFSDIIPLVAPMMRFRDSSIVRLPMPADHCDGLTSHQEGFVVFHQRLQEHINMRQGSEPDERKWVLKQYEALAAHFPEWEDETRAIAQGNDRSLQFLDKVHDCHDYTTEYFLRLQRDHRLRYSQLVESHLIHAVHYWGDAWGHIRENKARQPHDGSGSGSGSGSGMRGWLAEGAHMYWDYLPRVVASLTAGKTRYEMLTDETLIHEAWIMMMFRAFCWWRCHWMEVGEVWEGGGGGGGDGGKEMRRVGPAGETRLPSRYWNSKFQVYVG